MMVPVQRCCHTLGLPTYSPRETAQGASTFPSPNTIWLIGFGGRWPHCSCAAARAADWLLVVVVVVVVVVVLLLLLVVVVVASPC